MHSLGIFKAQIIPHFIVIIYGSSRVCAKPSQDKEQQDETVIHTLMCSQKFWSTTIWQEDTSGFGHTQNIC